MISIKNLSSGSKGNLYIVYNNNTKILLECGINKKSIIKKLIDERLNLRQFNACVISHAHSDHSQEIEYVNQYLPVYANERVYSKYPFKGKIIEHRELFNIGSIKVLPISVEHGQMQNTAFIFKDEESIIFWGTDFSNISIDKLNFKFNEIWIECNYIPKLLEEEINYCKDNEILETKYQRQLNTHMSLDNLIYTLKNKFNLEYCKKIVGIHVSQDVGNAELMLKTLKENFQNKECFLAKKEGGLYGNN